MGNSPDRLVRRLLQRQHDEHPASTPLPASPRETAELEARIRRLQSLGRSFQHIKLSGYVGSTGEPGASVHIGGACVATEV